MVDWMSKTEIVNMCWE